MDTGHAAYVHVHVRELIITHLLILNSSLISSQDVVSFPHKYLMCTPSDECCSLQCKALLSLLNI